MAYIMRMAGAVAVAVLAWAATVGVLFLLPPGVALVTMFVGLVLFMMGGELAWKWTAATGGILMFAGVFVGALT